MSCFIIYKLWVGVAVSAAAPTIVCFLDIDCLVSIDSLIKSVSLAKKGTIVIEVQYLLNTIKDLTFDNIYHEHTNYWSLFTLNKFLKTLDLIIFKVEKINTHGGSIRVYVSQDENISIDKSVKELIAEEEVYGLKKL